MGAEVVMYSVCIVVFRQAADAMGIENAVVVRRPSAMCMPAVGPESVLAGKAFSALVTYGGRQSWWGLYEIAMTVVVQLLLDCLDKVAAGSVDDGPPGVRVIEAELDPKAWRKCTRKAREGRRLYRSIFAVPTRPK